MTTTKQTKEKKTAAKKARPSAALRRKNARNPMEFDPVKVEHLAGLGLTHERIALALGCSERTVRNRLADDAIFAAAYARGRASREVVVASRLAERCDEGDVSAIKFYLQAVAGWKERQQIDMQAEITAEASVRIEDMSTEQLEAALSRLQG